MQNTPLRTKAPSKKQSFPTQYRLLLGWTTLLVVIGGYGAYLFHLKTPTQQQRLSTLEKHRERRVNLTSLIHQKNLKNQEGYHHLQAQKLAKQQAARRAANKKASAFDPVFQTTIQTAPDEEQVQEQTVNSFASHEVKVLEDQGPVRVNVAFKPVNDIKDIQDDYLDDEDIAGEVVEDSQDTQPKKATEFAIKLITSRSLYVIEEKWYELKEIDQDNILDELQPKYTITEISKGKKDYTLLAGPYQTAKEAVEICKELNSVTEQCSEAIYQGQDLFQSDPEDQFPVGSIDTRKAPPIR